MNIRGFVKLTYYKHFDKGTTIIFVRKEDILSILIDEGDIYVKYRDEGKIYTVRLADKFDIFMELMNKVN